MINKHSFYAQVFARIQYEFIEIGLLDDGGVPIKQKRTMEEDDGIAIYTYLKGKLVENRVPYSKALEYVEEGNAMVKKLINDKKIVNKYLLSLMLLREYLDEVATKGEQILVRPKVERTIALYGQTDDEKEIKKTTYRIANNLWRQLTGRPQLDDELRDNRFKRIVK